MKNSMVSLDRVFFLTLNQTCEVVNLSRSTIYRMKEMVDSNYLPKFYTKLCYLNMFPDLRSIILIELLGKLNVNYLI